MREVTPVVFMAFDLLYANGEMTMEKALLERRQALEELVLQEQPRTRVGSRLSSGQQTELNFEAVTADDFARLVLAPAAQLQTCCATGTGLRGREGTGK